MNKKSELIHCLLCRLFGNHLPVVELTPRSKCVYTRHPDLCHATSGVLTSQPPEHAKIRMRVKTLSDRRHKQILRVNTASGANWLNDVLAISKTFHQKTNFIQGCSENTHRTSFANITNVVPSFLSNPRDEAKHAWPLKHQVYQHMSTVIWS